MGDHCPDCTASPEDYSLVYLPVTLPSDMLAAESEDLLRYFSSSDMDTDELREFMDEGGTGADGAGGDGAAGGNSSGSSSSSVVGEAGKVTATNLLDLAATGALSTVEMSAADHGYLNGILNTDGEAIYQLSMFCEHIHCCLTHMSSTEGDIKSEPISPPGCGMALPPSPSGSSGSSGQLSNCPSSPSSSSSCGGAPLSPPYSPSDQAAAAVPVVLNGVGQLTAQPPPPPPQVVAVQDMSNLKIPIPKISRAGT